MVFEDLAISRFIGYRQIEMHGALYPHSVKEIADLRRGLVDYEEGISRCAYHEVVEALEMCFEELRLDLVKSRAKANLDLQWERLKEEWNRRNRRLAVAVSLLLGLSSVGGISQNLSSPIFEMIKGRPPTAGLERVFVFSITLVVFAAVLGCAWRWLRRQNL
jgi:hypothetical protein